ncbi:hypothetical protein HMPREF9548_01215 [Escherichia coli MS 182-1]|nr:hypothetical protein HMPREF9548_01215 [Escherichia coli MS 182-1]EGI44384.1 conserved hypothetical protein [Escherichia coli H591]
MEISPVPGAGDTLVHLSADTLLSVAGCSSSLTDLSFHSYCL